VLLSLTFSPDRIKLVVSVLPLIVHVTTKENGVILGKVFISLFKASSPLSFSGTVCGRIKLYPLPDVPRESVEFPSPIGAVNFL